MASKRCVVSALLLAGLLTLARAPECAAEPVPVPNGDFERGLAGWSLLKPDGFKNGELTIDGAQAHAGWAAARITNSPEGDQVLSGLTHGTCIPIPDEVRTFELRLWMKAHVAPRMIEVRLASAGRDGRALTPWEEKGWRFFRPQVEPHVGQWYEARMPFAAQPEWGGIFITVWANGPGADLLIDDISLEAIDPRMWAIEGIGRRLRDPAPGVALWWESPMRKVYPDETAPTEPGDGLELAAAGGECETVQLCVRPPAEVPDARVSFSDLTGPATIPATALRANFVGLVEVREAKGGRSITGPTPDPLLTADSMTLPGGATTAIWLTARVPRGTSPGTYSGMVSLSGEGISAQVPLRLRVYGFDLPQEPSLRTIARIWQRHEGYLDLFHRNLQEHRCAGSGYIEGIAASREGDRVIVDAAGLHESARRLVGDFGVRVFNVPRVFLGDAGGVYAKDNKWMGFEMFTPGFDAAFSSYCKQVGDALRAEGIARWAIWQIWDEPHGEMVEKCLHIARLVKQAVPDARIYLTTGVEEDLVDLVGIWCLPWPSTYSEQDAARARAKGAELWAYDNSLYGLDAADSSLRMRHFLWSLKRCGIVGVEWWAISQWTSDPWAVPNQYEPQNGGGFFLYPTPDRTGAPIDSIRWEMYREGVEDYDILSVLAREQDAALERLGMTGRGPSGEAVVRTLVDTVASSPSEITKDPIAADSAKRRACERIERLLGDPKAALEPMG